MIAIYFSPPHAGIFFASPCRRATLECGMISEDFYCGHRFWLQFIFAGENMGKRYPVVLCCPFPWKQRMLWQLSSILNFIPWYFSCIEKWSWTLISRLADWQGKKILSFQRKRQSIRWVGGWCVGGWGAEHTKPDIEVTPHSSELLSFMRKGHFSWRVDQLTFE